MADHATYHRHPLSGYEPARLVPVLQAEEELRGLLIASLAGSAADYRRFLGRLGSHLRAYYKGKLTRSGRPDTEAEDLVLQCQRGPQAIGLGAFPGLPLAVFVAGRDMASQCKKRGKLCPSPCVPTGGQRPSMFP